jgi:two-component system chemotaxis response regulator CheY
MPTVLYVEDDQEQRSMMRVILRDQNLTLLEAVNGQEALEKIERQRPDLILLDLFMPKVDGIGVLEAVKSNSDTYHIPIIVVSAWPTGDNRDRARKAGATDFITKPYDPFELVKIVKKYLTSPTKPLYHDY